MNTQPLSFEWSALQWRATDQVFEVSASELDGSREFRFSLSRGRFCHQTDTRCVIISAVSVDNVRLSPSDIVPFGRFHITGTNVGHTHNLMLNVNRSKIIAQLDPALAGLVMDLEGRRPGASA